jgi:hypothetical protein
MKKEKLIFVSIREYNFDNNIVEANNQLEHYTVVSITPTRTGDGSSSYKNGFLIHLKLRE